MKGKLLAYLVGLILRELKPDKVRELADHVIDWVEDQIVGSDNKLDDKLLPLIGMVRSAFNIPDNE